MAAMPVLKPLHDEAGLVRLVASTYQAVSGAGAPGVDELDKQVRGKSATAPPSSPTTGLPSLFPNRRRSSAPIAFNVLPFAGNSSTTDRAETDEEQKLRNGRARSSTSPTSRCPARASSTRRTPVTRCH